MALNRTAIVTGAVIMCAAAATWLMSSRFADKSQSDEAAAREFATRFRGLADRFAAEPTTDTGNQLRTEVFDHLSEDPGSAPMSLQMECRQTICRVQLSGPEPDKSKTMQEITYVGGFRQVVGMERPLGDGAVMSDVYLVMN
jgi:uncharacterized protein (DUF2267 family)